jgi:hypothetical protein
MNAIPVPILDPEVNDTPTCRHHWLIDTPRGSVTRGVCRHCGAVKEYQSAWNGSVWDHDDVKEPVVRNWSNGVDE